MHKLDNLPKAVQFVSGGTGIGSQIVRDKSPAVVTMLWKFPINKHDCIEILHLHFGGIPPPLYLFSLPEIYFEEMSKFSLGGKSPAI